MVWSNILSPTHLHFVPALCACTCCCVSTVPTCVLVQIIHGSRGLSFVSSSFSQVASLSVHHHAIGKEGDEVLARRFGRPCSAAGSCEGPSSASTGDQGHEGCVVVICSVLVHCLRWKDCFLFVRCSVWITRYQTDKNQSIHGDLYEKKKIPELKTSLWV